MSERSVNRVIIQSAPARTGRRSAPKANAWSSADLRELRELASAGVAIEAIAARLRRSASAVRNKAGMHGISLRR